MLMPRHIVKFLRLTPRERRCLISALFMLSAIRLALWTISFQVIMRYTLKHVSRAEELNESNYYSIDQLTRAVKVASIYVPGATCLTQALTLQLLLARRGHKTRLCIGVDKEGTGKLKAHAWLESNGRILVGSSGVESYVPLTSFSEESV
jgi:hypothetical protein